MDLFEKYKNCLSCNGKLNSLEDFNYCTNLFCKDKFIVYEHYIEYEKYLKNNTSQLAYCNFLTKEFKFIKFTYNNYLNGNPLDNPLFEVEFEIDDDFDFIESLIKIEKSIENNTLFM